MYYVPAIIGFVVGALAALCVGLALYIINMGVNALIYR